MKSGARRLVVVQQKALPIITERQIERISTLADRLDSLSDDFARILEELSCQLCVLNGSNNPEGWDEPVVVAERVES